MTERNKFPPESIHYRIERLRARIKQLRDEGHASVANVLLGILDLLDDEL